LDDQHLTLHQLKQAVFGAGITALPLTIEETFDMSRIDPPDNMRRWAAHVAKQHPQINEVLQVGEPATGWRFPFWH
jgi:hypothetical protein